MTDTGASKTRVDRSYSVPLGKISQQELPHAMNAAIDELKHRFPGLGVTLFVFEYGQGGGLAYGSTGRREDNLRMILEWARKQLGV